MKTPPPPQRFRDAYATGEAPWDIGRPQPAFIELADTGRIRGRVLDVGCGTGENALLLAARGFEVVGVDAVSLAIDLAQHKSAARGLDARFEVADALDLSGLGLFDTVIDCGVFHVFDDTERARYVESLGRVVAPGGRLFMLVFSDAETREGGPRRLRQEEIEQSFADGWSVQEIVPHRFESTVHEGGARAWRAELVRS